MIKLGFGVMGPGNIAKRFAAAVKKSHRAALVAVASKSIDRAKVFSEQYEIPYYYDSYELLCKNQEVDIVYIATTNNYHYENILACIENKKHVICEKPMVMTKAQAEDVFNKAQVNNVFVMEGLWSRFLPSVLKAKELIKEGVIGEVKHIASSFNYLLPYDPNWRIFNKKLGGGVLYDLGIYCISLSMMFASEKPVEYSGYCSKCSEGTDIADSVIMRFPGGATAGFMCSNEVNSRNEMIIYGTKGSIKLNSRFSKCNKIELFDREEVIQSFEYDFENGFIYEIEGIIDCINSDKLQSGIISWKDTVDCIEVIERLLTDWGITDE